MNLTDQRKLEIQIEALLKHASQLEESVAYWHEETDKAWETAKRWKAEADNKAADAINEADELCRMIEEIGGLIQLIGGGTMERHPCDAILHQVKLILTPIAKPTQPPPTSSA